VADPAGLDVRRLALGETSELVASLRELIGERPLDESLWSLLVTALALSGRTGEALAAFDEARRTFVDELGIEPGPELRGCRSGCCAATRSSTRPGAVPARAISAATRHRTSCPRTFPLSSAATRRCADSHAGRAGRRRCLEHVRPC